MEVIAKVAFKLTVSLARAVTAGGVIAPLPAIITPPVPANATGQEVAVAVYAAVLENCTVAAAPKVGAAEGTTVAFPPTSKTPLTVTVDVVFAPVPYRPRLT